MPAGHRATGPNPARRRWPGYVGVALVVLVVLVAIVAALLPSLLPAEPALDQQTQKLAAAVIFIASYLALAVGKIPGLSIDRAGVALVGACLMVASGVLPLEDAYRAVDLDTITLLLGMMIVVASLRLSGFFALATTWILRGAKNPLVLLAAVTATSGIFSAFLVNDAICLVLAPLVLEITLRMGRTPVPYLLAVAMASNVGSSATITGNPQNMLIGGFSRIAYLDFALALGPVALAGLFVTAVLIALLHRDEFFAAGRLSAAAPVIRVNRALVARALAATAAMVALFFAGQPPAKAAILMGGLLLLTRRVKSRRVYADIDWSLLLMFAGLFIIVAGAQRALLTPEMIAGVGRLHLDQIPDPEPRDRRPLQPRQQRPRRAGHAPVRRPAAQPRPRLAHRRHGLHARRQLHHPRLHRQPDRRAEGRRARDVRSVSGSISASARTFDPAHALLGMTWLAVFRTGWLSL